MREVSAPIHPRKLREVRRVFQAGGLIAYPTEAVYGLGCDPLNWLAIQRLLNLKGREMEKGVILIASDFCQLRPFVRPLTAEQMAPLLGSWPGPNTWIMPAADHLPDWLTGARDTLAVRVTDHPVCAALCRSCESPLVSTSANPSGRRPARTALSVRRYFGDRLECLVHGVVGGLKRPSRIRCAIDGRVIRE